MVYKSGLMAATLHVFLISKVVLPTRSWVCFVLFLIHHGCMFETLFDKTYTIKQSLNDKSCRPEHVELSVDTVSEINCVFHCSRTLNSSGIFHSWINNRCQCCSMIYTLTDELPTIPGTVYYISGKATYRDCADALVDGVRDSGVQQVRTPLTSTTIEVYCDMDTLDGGWLVFQNRFDGSVSFRRNFTDYEDGFGDVRGEHWLGLKYLYEFASLPSMVKIYLKFVDACDEVAFEYFEGFYMSPGPGYDFHVGHFLDANDGTSPPNTAKSFATTKQMPFSTEDVDNDKMPDAACAKIFEGAWWFRNCATMNPNGPYIEPGTDVDRNAFHHKTWRNMKSLKASRLMIRKS